MKFFSSPIKLRQDLVRASLQRGQSMFEYLLISAIFAFALGVGMVDSTSPLRMFIDAFQTAYKNFSYAISLPD